jgi:hypothetical protein
MFWQTLELQFSWLMTAGGFGSCYEALILGVGGLGVTG